MVAGMIGSRALRSNALANAMIRSGGINAASGNPLGSFLVNRFASPVALGARPLIELGAPGE
jgi:hypothetical protein